MKGFRSLYRSLTSCSHAYKEKHSSMIRTSTNAMTRDWTLYKNRLKSAWRKKRAEHSDLPEGKSRPPGSVYRSEKGTGEIFELDRPHQKRDLQEHGDPVSSKNRENGLDATPVQPFIKTTGSSPFILNSKREKDGRLIFAKIFFSRLSINISRLKPGKRNTCKFQTGTILARR